MTAASEANPALVLPNKFTTSGRRATASVATAAHAPSSIRFAWTDKEGELWTATKPGIDWVAVATSGPRYMARTCTLSLLLTGLGLLLVLPLSQLARVAFEHVLAKEGDGRGIAGLHPYKRSLSDGEGMWAVFAFTLLCNLYQSLSHLASRWAVMGLGWHGWNRARSWPLLITIVNVCFYMTVKLVTGILTNEGLITPLAGHLVNILMVTPPNIYMVVAINKLSSRTMSWQRVLKYVLVSTLLEWTCIILVQGSLSAFFMIESEWGRIVIRLIPTAVRRFWLHGNCLLSLRFDVSQEENRFLFMVMPIGSTAIVGACMQMVSSQRQAALMGLLGMVLEVIDALVLLGGKTQVELSRQWFVLVSKHARQQLQSVLPGLSSTAEEVAAAQKQAAAREACAQRRPQLVAAAVHVCVAEATSVALVGVQLLLLPISIDGVGEAAPAGIVARVLLIALALELATDGITACISCALSQRWPESFVDATAGRAGLRVCSFSGLIAYGVILITSADVIGLFLSSLCVYGMHGDLRLKSCDA
eukprot:TRINITY_DN12548_c0_g1_i3.p1 TRINITY_DN12548_c0_g1~~TRINITY_DN12548_c0_g1_i3.p1  ORF type:complete len:567 (+),score=69.64 TRINITY_DN12548_c0_g1_i3:103-1701(+)